MQSASADMIHEMFSQPALRPVTLVTIHGGGLVEPLLVTDCVDRLPASSARGFISAGGYGSTLLGAGPQTYMYFPFGAQWVGAGSGEASRSVKLTIGNSDGEIARAIRAADPMPYVTIETVRRSAPDVVEMAIKAAKIRSVDIAGASVEGTLEPRTLSRTPAVRARYVLSRTPAVG
jgi:hypothetical protein